MQSKRSFFNSTLFVKNLTRSWPLWGSVTALGSLVPLFLMLSSVNVRMDLTAADFTEFLYSAAVYFLPSATFVYALLVAVFVWGYLHNSRAVGMMHSLAVDRVCLFVTGTLSGLAMLLIPYVVVGFLLCLFSASHGVLPIGGILVTIAIVLLENLLFFGMATLCAFVSGSRAAMVLYYLILNFAAPILDGLVSSLAQNFLFGFYNMFHESSVWFSPLSCITSRVEVLFHGADSMPSINGFPVLLLYGAVGAVMLAVSLVLYRFRRSESAGDVVAFSWLRPVFRFAIAIVSSLTLGRVLYELFWVSLNGGRQSVLAAVVFLCLGTMVGYYAASMLLEKSLRVFRGSLRNVGIVCAVTAALCLSVALDVFGIESYVPDSSEIRTVYVSGALEFTCDADEMPELLDDIRALHSEIISDKNYVEAMEEAHYYSDSSDLHWRGISFHYTLKNGSTVERYYYLPLRDARMQEPGTYENLLYALTKDPKLLEASVSVPENAEFLYGRLEYCAEQDGSWNSAEIDSKAFAVIYDALLRDAAEGNFVMDHTGWIDAEKYGKQNYLDATLFYEYYIGNEIIDYDYHPRYIDLQPTMVHTLKALVSSGILTQQELDDLLSLQ